MPKYKMHRVGSFNARRSVNGYFNDAQISFSYDILIIFKRNAALDERAQLFDNAMIDSALQIDSGQGLLSGSGETMHEQVFRCVWRALHNYQSKIRGYWCAIRAVNPNVPAAQTPYLEFRVNVKRDRAWIDQKPEVAKQELKRIGPTKLKSKRSSRAKRPIHFPARSY